MKDPANVRLQRAPDGTRVLWIYQTKLTSVPPRYRWKLIPLIFEEQRKVPAIIESKELHRPIVKTVREHFGPYTTLYGRRKGFTDLMLSRNQRLDFISQWMGHSTIDRTWQNYKSRLCVHFVRGRRNKCAHC